MTIRTDRRSLLAGAGAALLGAPALASLWQPERRADGVLVYGPEPGPLVDFEAMISHEVRIRDVQVWRTPNDSVHLIRVISEDGVEGVVRGSTKVDETLDFHRQFAAPRFVGEDAREVQEILEDAFRDDYEYAGLPYWNVMGQVECAVWDLLGKTAGKRCADMMGGALRESIPIYVSSNRRNTTPEVELEHLQEAVAATGARALKVKIGRRMGRNTDFLPGRSEGVIAGVRDHFGPDFWVSADANGAFDVPGALAIIDMLRTYGVDHIEEPCPFEDFEMTAQLASMTDYKLAGGEQDYALERWRWYIHNRVFDIIQPDMMYGGGILRWLAVNKMAILAGLGVAPHFPRNNADSALLLHVCAAAPNLYGYQEYRSRPVPLDYDHTPEIAPVNGEIALPPGPGWGVEVDPGTWTRCERVA